MVTKISHKTDTTRIVSGHIFDKCFLSQKGFYAKKTFGSSKNVFVNKLYFNKKLRPNLSLIVIFIVFVPYFYQEMF